MKITIFKRLLLSTAVTVAAMSAAYATDLPSKKDPIPPAVSDVATAFSKSGNPNWTGPYVGFFAGYGWNNATLSTQGINDGGSLDQPEAGSYYPDSLTHSQAAAAVLTGRGSGHSKGIFGGIEIGNNWQVHNDYVVGIEGDFAWLNSKSKTNYSGNQTVCYDYYPDPSYPWLNGPCATDQYEYDTVGSGVSTTAVVDWLSTIRARAGYLIQPNLLTFATGGLALGRVNTSVNISENWTSNYNWQGTITPGEFSYSNPYSVSSSHSAIRVGYAVGGGAEWMISEHWTLKGEYLYYNLGTASFNSDPLVINATYVDNDPNIPVATTAHVRAKAQIDGNLARLGVNYKF